MKVKANSGSGGSGSTLKSFEDSQSYTSAQTKTFTTGISNLHSVMIQIVASAGIQYIATFIWKKTSTGFATQAFYTSNSGGGVNNDGTKYNYVAGALPQCPNITNIDSSGTITAVMPNAQTWNIGTVFCTAVGE